MLITRRQRRPRRAMSIRGGSLSGGVPEVSAPTAWLDPSLRIFQDAAGTVPATSNSDPVQRWVSSGGAIFTDAVDPGDLRLALDSGSLVVQNDPALGFGTTFTGSATSPGHQTKYEFAFWFKTEALFGGFTPTFQVGGTSVQVSDTAGSMSVGGTFAYHVPPATNGTRTWTQTAIGVYDVWYLIRLTVDLDTAYAIRVYNESGTLLQTISTSSAVPTGGRIRMDAGSLGYQLCNSPDGSLENRNGYAYQSIGSLWTADQWAAIIAAGYAM